MPLEFKFGLTRQYGENRAEIVEFVLPSGVRLQLREIDARALETLSLPARELLAAAENKEKMASVVSGWIGEIISAIDYDGPPELNDEDKEALMAWAAQSFAAYTRKLMHNAGKVM